MALTDNQKTYMRTLLAGPTHVPAIVYSRLSALGMVEKADGPSGGRGQTFVKITSAGIKALEA